MYGPLNDYCPSCRSLKIELDQVKATLKKTHEEKQQAVQELKKIKWHAKQTQETATP